MPRQCHLQHVVYTTNGSRVVSNQLAEGERAWSGCPWDGFMNEELTKQRLCPYSNHMDSPSCKSLWEMQSVNRGRGAFVGWTPPQSLAWILIYISSSYPHRTHSSSPEAAAQRPMWLKLQDLLVMTGLGVTPKTLELRQIYPPLHWQSLWYGQGIITVTTPTGTIGDIR